MEQKIVKVVQTSHANNIKCMTMAGKVVKNKNGAKLKGGKIKKMYFKPQKNNFSKLECREILIESNAYRFKTS